MSSIAQTLTQHNLLALIADGPHWNGAIGEWEIWLDGEAVAWAGDIETARRSYEEMLRVEREHITRNPDNAIPFNGELVGNGDETSEQARLGLPVEW